MINFAYLTSILFLFLHEIGLVIPNSSIYPLLSKFVETNVFPFPSPMLEEDIRLRSFQSLKVDRNHTKLNLNQLLSLNKLESVREKFCRLLKIKTIIHFRQ